VNPEAITLGAALLVGLLGSGHCVGMCGAMALLPGAGPEPAPRWAMLSYNLARMTSYAILGAVAGGFGAALGQLFDLSFWSLVLRVATGAVIVLIGLMLVTGNRNLAIAERLGASLWRRVSPLAQRLRGGPPGLRLVGLGLLWGLLPCGLVYSVLLAASVSGSAAQGALTMAAFGLGTVPSMLGLGLAGGALLTRLRRPRFRWSAGVVLVLCGLWLAAWPVYHALGRSDPQGGHGHHGSHAARVVAQDASRA